MTDRTEVLRQIETEVGVLIRRVRRVIRERSEAVHPDLQPASYLILGYIQDHGPVRASAMGAVFGIDKGALSRHAQHLIDLGLVDRAPDPEDGRATLLTVSDDGQRRIDAVAAMRRKALDERLNDWTAGELADFAGMLRRYNDALSPPTDR
jgi:DNA-binding MarR family transcriptional regulator